VSYLLGHSRKEKVATEFVSQDRGSSRASVALRSSFETTSMRTKSTDEERELARTRIKRPKGVVAVVSDQTGRRAEQGARFGAEKKEIGESLDHAARTRDLHSNRSTELGGIAANGGRNAYAVCVHASLPGYSYRLNKSTIGGEGEESLATCAWKRMSRRRANTLRQGKRSHVGPAAKSTEKGGGGGRSLVASPSAKPSLELTHPPLS